MANLGDVLHAGIKIGELEREARLGRELAALIATEINVRGHNLSEEIEAKARELLGKEQDNG